MKGRRRSSRTRDVLEEGRDVLDEAGEDALEEGRDVLEEAGDDALEEAGDDALEEARDALGEVRDVLLFSLSPKRVPLSYSAK